MIRNKKVLGVEEGFKIVERPIFSKNTGFWKVLISPFLRLTYEKIPTVIIPDKKKHSTTPYKVEPNS